MSKIAHLKVNCPQCGKYTSIYVVEDGGTNAKVRCEHCKQVFEFGAGMMYEPVAYVPSIPTWAVISKADERKSFSQAVKCKKCGAGYTELHVKMEEPKDEHDANSILSGLLREAIGNEVGIKSLYKCGNCSTIACSDCSGKSDGIKGKSCPFCKTDYTIHSRIKPTMENISGEAGANRQQTGTQPDTADDKKAGAGNAKHSGRRFAIGAIVVGIVIVIFGIFLLRNS